MCISMEYPDPAEEVPTVLQPCSVCGRTFRPDALQRHQKVCEKNANKKRKQFDSSKQRAVEDAPKPILVKTKEPKKSGPNSKGNDVKPKPKGNWREKHEELIRTIKKARGQEDKNDSEKGEEKSRVPSDYVQCPGCQRHFNQRAAERHIPWCQKKKSESPKSPATDEAKEKLIARVKYRPPQGKSRFRNSKTSSSVQSEPKSQNKERQSESRSSPPKLVDNRNSRKDVQDRINNNVSSSSEPLKKRSSSLSREKEFVPPELPRHIIKFKEKFPNHINKRNCDLEESLTSEQLRELLSCSKSSIRCPRTVPGVRLSRGNQKPNENVKWNYSRSTDVSRSASSTGGSSNSWSKRFLDDSTLPEVSGSELPGTWRSKLCWNGDLNHSLSSTASSSSSNGSLPPLSRESTTEANTAFYCHQCSSKFPLLGAKYCCECGARRRGICISQVG